MLVPDEKDMEKAMKKLEEAGFQHTPWSYATIDPKILSTEPVTQRIHDGFIRGYQRLDAHSVRYHFPPSFRRTEKVVLLQSSYVHLCPPPDPASSVGLSQTLPANSAISPHFYAENNLYYPDKVTLLESFIKVILDDKDTGYLRMWHTLLGGWAVSYVYGQLNVANDALDGCEDADVREWFNKAIHRARGGLDRSITKRHGRVNTMRAAGAD